MTTAIEQFNATLATVETSYEYTVTERDYRGEPAIMLADTADGIEGDGSGEFEAYEAESRMIVKALESAGFEMRDSGANGGKDGGFYSIWTTK